MTSCSLDCIWIRSRDVFRAFLVFVKQKTAYEMRISVWRSDVCSSELPLALIHPRRGAARHHQRGIDEVVNALELPAHARGPVHRADVEREPVGDRKSVV